MGTNRCAVSCFAVIVCVLLAGGCTTRHVLGDAAPDRLATSVRVGDTVRVATHDNVTQKFTVAAIDPDALRGVTRAGTSVELPYSDITRVEYRRLAVAKTSGLVAGIVTLLQS
jgi:hypothetical protein